MNAVVMAMIIAAAVSLAPSPALTLRLLPSPILTTPTCPAGESYMHKFATTSVVFEGGCVTEEARARINRVFERFFCLTSSHAYQKGEDSFRRTNTWDDITGCTSVDTCVVKGKSIPLTKGLFGGECPLVKVVFGGGQ